MRIYMVESEKLGATVTDDIDIAKLVESHPNINVGEGAMPDGSFSDYIAELSSNFNGWSFRTNGYLNQVFEDPSKMSGMVMLANKTRWAPENGWQDWIETQANNSDIARMMRTHSKIVVANTLVGGDVNVRTMINSDLDKSLFFDKFLRMHLDWNTYGFTIAEPVFSRKDPEREKQLALQRVYKTKPTANQGSGKLTFRQPSGVEPTNNVPYAASNVSSTYTSSKKSYDKNNPYPWVETQNTLPIAKDDTSNDDIDVHWEWHLVDLLILNPMSIRICRNNMEDVQYLRSKFGTCANEEWAAYVNSSYCDYGNGAYIIGFVQFPFNEEGHESILFYPHELIFIPRYASHSYPNGVSQLREAYKEIVLREILEESMVATAKRWGDPIMKFTVDHNIWQKRELVQKMLSQIKYSRSMGMDIVVPEGVGTETIESSGGVDLIGGPLEYITNKLNKIMQWADSFTESDASNRSLGEVQLSFMEIDAEPERKLFASVFYKCIFLPLTVANGYKESDCPSMSFDPINPKDNLEWGQFYSGLTDMMDAGQLTAFFESIDLPYTNPIDESPMEKEKRIEAEEKAKEEAESMADENGMGGLGMEDERADESGEPGIISSSDVNVPKYPSPFGGSGSSKPSPSGDDESSINIESDEIGNEDDESGPKMNSALGGLSESFNGYNIHRRNKLGTAERVNNAISNKKMREAHSKRVAKFKNGLKAI